MTNTASLLASLRAACPEPVFGSEVAKKIAELEMRLTLQEHYALLAVAETRPATCPKCKMGEIVVTPETWGNAHDCTVCDYHMFFSIGD